MSSHIREYQAAYRAKNREKMKAYNAEYYKQNGERIRECALEYQAQNREESTARQAKWRAENPERVKAVRHRHEVKPEYKAQKLAAQRRRYATPEGRMRGRSRIKEYREKNPEKVKVAKINQHYRSKYGITTAERDRLFEAQGKRCRICRSKTSAGKGFHVDHCHTTKQIRGILCHHCNLMLGNSKDSVEVLEAAIAYLKEQPAA